MYPPGLFAKIIGIQQQGHLKLKMWVAVETLPQLMKEISSCKGWNPRYYLKHILNPNSKHLFWPSYSRKSVFFLCSQFFKFDEVLLCAKGHLKIKCIILLSNTKFEHGSKKLVTSKTFNDVWINHAKFSPKQHDLINILRQPITANISNYDPSDKRKKKLNRALLSS